MGHRQPKALSRAQLTELLQCEEQRIEELSTMLADLQVRMVRLEAQFDQLAVVAAQRERELATRDALRHLEKVDYLTKSNLAQIVTNLHGQPVDGRSLRSALIRAIRGMEPLEDPSYQTPEHRYYDVLHLTYMRKKNAEEVARALGISKRQYYRDLKGAISLVAEQVLEP